MIDPICFSGSSLDRAAEQRRDHGWLEEQLADPASRVLPLWQGRLLLKREPHTLAWARSEFFRDLETPEPVLLGLEGGVAHFAIDVSALEKPEEKLAVAEVAQFCELLDVVAGLSEDDASIAAQARSLVDWHARHRFCAACGGETRSMQGGANRICRDCQAEHFPRTDPVAIAVVVEGDDCLLGRSPGWPDRMLSALAGFVEPGETLEEAVRREVWEEVGVRVGAVEYLQSQPWPFPSSLMLGCVAHAESRALRIDPVEIEEARWIPRDLLRAALAGDATDIEVPPAYAIAHQLIRAWLEAL